MPLEIDFHNHLSFRLSRPKCRQQQLESHVSTTFPFFCIIFHIPFSHIFSLKSMSSILKSFSLKRQVLTRLVQEVVQGAASTVLCHQAEVWRVAGAVEVHHCKGKSCDTYEDSVTLASERFGEWHAPQKFTTARANAMTPMRTVSSQRAKGLSLCLGSQHHSEEYA